MAKVRDYTLECYKSGGWTALARVELPSGNYIAQATISTVHVEVKNAAGTITKASASLTVSDVVFDTLQNDARWTEDTTGFNFRYEVPAAAFPAAGHHRVEFKFTPSTGEVFFLTFEGIARGTF